MLSLLRRPDRLDADPLAIVLRESLGAPSSLVAIQTIVHHALDGTSPLEVLKRESVMRCDFGDEKAPAVARRLGFSIRQFYRHRAAAVAAVAHEVNRVLDAQLEPANYQLALAEMIARFDSRAALTTHLHSIARPTGQAAYELVCLNLRSNQPIPADLLSRCDGHWRLLALAALGRRCITVGEPKEAAPWRGTLRAALAKSRRPENVHAAFELANIERLEAVRVSDMPAARKAAHRMTWLGKRDVTLRGMALVVELEQACDDSRLDLADSIVTELKAHNAVEPNFRIMARTEHARGVLSFMRDDFEEAYAFSSTAAAALKETEPGFALCAHANAGRAAALLRRAWHSPLDLCRRFPNVWITGHIAAVQSRHLLADEPDRARFWAEKAIGIAKSQEAFGALAYGNASLALVADRLGDYRRSQSARVHAWESALQLGRQTYLHDMFSHPEMMERDIGSFALDALYRKAIARRVEAHIQGYPIANNVRHAQLLERLCVLAIERAGQSDVDLAANQGPEIEDLMPLFGSRSDTREIATAVRAVLKAVAKEIAICARVDQRHKIPTAFAGILDDLRRFSTFGSRRAYETAS